MTKRLPCPPAPGPLEAYAERFDDGFGTLAQRRGFREYVQGLLLPRDRHKTLTGLVGVEPVVGAQAASAQRLQFFVSESTWDAEAMNRRRLDAGGAPRPRGAPGDLVGGRSHLRPRRTSSGTPRGGGHHRPGHAAPPD